MRELQLSDFGLMTVEQAAATKGVHPTTVREWVAKGKIPALVVGAGRSAKYLVRASDVKEYEPQSAGAPKGNRNAAKDKD